MTTRGRFDRLQNDSDPAVLQDMARRIANIIRTGTVSEVDAKKGRARVKIGDITTDWIKWHAGRSGDDSNWNPPSPGEQVTLMAMSGRLEHAVILPGLFSKTKDSPDNDENHRHTSMKDGTNHFHDVKNSVRQMSMPSKGSNTTFVGQKGQTNAGATGTDDSSNSSSSSHAQLANEHVFAVGSDMIVSFSDSKVHVHFADSGFIIEKGSIKIESPLLILPPNIQTGGTTNAAPANNTPSNSIPQKSGDTSSTAQPGDTALTGDS